MAIIKSVENTSFIYYTVLNVGWVASLIFVLLGIKLKWFRANFNLNSTPVNENVQNGVYRQAYNPDSYRNFDSVPYTSQQLSQQNHKEIPKKQDGQNIKTSLDKPSTSSSNSQSTSSFNTQNVQTTIKHKNDLNQNSQIKSTKLKVSNVSNEKPTKIKKIDKVKSSEKNIVKKDKSQKSKYDDTNVLKQPSKDKSKSNDKFKKENTNKDDKKYKTKTLSSNISSPNKPSLNKTSHEENKKQKLKNSKTTEIKNEEIYETPKVHSNDTIIQPTLNITHSNKIQSDSNKNMKQLGHVSSNAYSSTAASIFLGEGYDNFGDNNIRTAPKTSQLTIGGFTNFGDNDSLTSNTSA